MCQVHKILKKYTITFQIIKNTLKIALCYVPSIHKIYKKYHVFIIFLRQIFKKYKKIYTGWPKNNGTAYFR